MRKFSASFQKKRYVKTGMPFFLFSRKDFVLSGNLKKCLKQIARKKRAGLWVLKMRVETGMTRKTFFA